MTTNDLYGKTANNPDFLREQVAQAAAEAEATGKAPSLAVLEKSDATVFDAIDIEASTGTYYATNRPPVIIDTIQGLPEGTLGALTAAPGAGKSTAFAQLCASAGAGVPWLGIFPIKKRCKVLYLSGEELQASLHQRINEAITRLPATHMDEAAANIVARSIRGDVGILKEKGLIEKTPAWHGLLRLLDKVQPNILLLDHFGLFVHLENENNNVKLKEACSLLDGLCVERNLTIIAASHVNKANARLSDTQDDLRQALDATAARGGTALTGAVRWQCNMAMLTQKLAGSIIGPEGKQRRDGAFVGIKISKANYGELSDIYYLERKPGSSYLERANTEHMERRQASTDSDVEHLVKMVRKRREQGLPPFAWSSGIMGIDEYSDTEEEAWGKKRYEKARNSAEAQGKLMCANKDKGYGKILVEAPQNTLFERG